MQKQQALMLFIMALFTALSRCQSSGEQDEWTSGGVECSVCRCIWDDGQALICLTSELNASDPFQNIPESPDIVSVTVFRDAPENSGSLTWPMDDELVKRFPNVRSLNFDGCTFKTIEHGFLNGLSNLQSLTFFSNGLREIPVEALAPVAGSVRELDIFSQSGLTEIRNDVNVPLLLMNSNKRMYAIGGGVGILAFAAVIFGVVVFIRFRRIKLMRGGFIFAGRGLRRKKNNGQEERLVYDAAVYHHDDEVEFVDERLRPHLENHPNNFRLCLPLIRDFRLGVKRLNGLRESLVSSMCAVFVISHAFVIDARCRQALEVACDYLHRDDLGPPHIKQTGLILILLDPVLLENLPEAIRVLVDRLITLEWNNLDEERCWKRLEQSLHDFGRQAENEV
ncbi:uncharacterized protein [Diadema antillarum]|uniref:uncharacterized protein n=1 Tax=Diadema antillarum TaxID=105358 RepID=UPI003A8695A3